jgi:hypothetical protein
MKIIDHSDENHCVHGTYVGGCGIDWMCGQCENGDTEPLQLPDIYPWERYDRGTWDSDGRPHKYDVHVRATELRTLLLEHGHDGYLDDFQSIIGVLLYGEKS